MYSSSKARGPLSFNRGLGVLRGPAVESEHGMGYAERRGRAWEKAQGLIGAKARPGRLLPPQYPDGR